MPKAEFYDALYSKVLAERATYGEFPPEWRAGKEAVASALAEAFPPGAKLLSIGAGLGYVEYLLWKAGFPVAAVEPSRVATRLLEGVAPIPVLHGYFPDALSGVADGKFDAAYLVAVDYAMDDAALENLLLSARAYGIRDLVMASVTTYRRFDVQGTMKHAAKTLLVLSGLRPREQLWGYQRTVAELRDVMTRAGYSQVEDRAIDGAHLIRGTSP